MAVNKELFNDIADAIEKEPKMYDQSAWGNFTCNTPGCIAGWATHLKGVNPEEFNEDNLVENAVRYLFNVTPEEEFPSEFFPVLFYAWWPVSWFTQTGIGIKGLTVLENTIQPNAHHAAIICRAIADGKIPENEVLHDKSR